MALVITLILLSVTLVMAIAFLAISRRERGSVTTTTDTAMAKYAADAALAKAESRIVSQMMTTTNPYIFSLMVSTNYINQNGFSNTPASLASNPENVNYTDYAPGQSRSGALSPQDFEQNVANLLYDPRPPVFYASNDFRFYLDLNRNGRFDTNGWVTNLNNQLLGLGTTSLEVGDPEWIGVLEHPDAPHSANNPFIARYCFIAVPANSLDLNHIHNQVWDTPRSAGGVVPVNPTTGEDTYYRDQGVGTWEINLAAFLADLNTNQWGDAINSPLRPGYYFYQYQPHDNYGIAFDDARALVAWRYANNYNLLGSPENIFAGGFAPNTTDPGYVAFNGNGIDYYGMQQQLTFDTNFAGYVNPALPWAGAASTNDYFGSPSDLFNTNKALSPNGLGYNRFAIDLQSAGTGNSTYDRYTFYRLLGQLGTDTQPPQGQINLNYANAVVNYDFNAGDIARYGPAVTNVPLSITVVPDMETNFINWQPHDFFTAAADKMLRAYTAEWYESSPSNYLQTYYGITDPSFLSLDGVGVTNGYQYYGGQINQIPSFGITNIPVYVNGQFVYTPAVNRLLQLAANIYDATTNTMTSVNSNYPSVFRPIFWVTRQYNTNLGEYFNNVYIKGYQYVYEPLNAFTANLNGNIFAPPLDITDPQIANLAATGGGLLATNIWGVPWIIGAKKGLPNLNQLEVENSFFIERLLQMQKRSQNPATMYATNQMYIMAVTNYFGAKDWNSYVESYNNPVSIVASDNISIGMTWTNDSEIPAFNNPGAGASFVNTLYAFTNIDVQPWYGNGSVMMFGTNNYSYTLTIPGAFSWEYGPYETALMNSAEPAYLNLSTNADFIYYYGTTPQTFSSLAGTYTFAPPCFIPTCLDPSNYLDSGTPPLPQMTLWITNRVQAYMLDTHDPNGNYILDYVQLGGMNSSVNVNQAVADNSIHNPNSPGEGYTQGLWSTNFFQGDVPQGIDEQILTSLPGGSVPSEDQDGGGWSAAAVTGLSGQQYTTPAAEQAYFQAFFTSPSGLAQFHNDMISNYETSIQLPFTPTRTFVQRFVYEANDPLVHYMISDLNDQADITNNLVVDNPPLAKLCSPDDRYMPWGNAKNTLPPGVNFGYPPSFQATDYRNAYNLSYKDPLVWQSDNWDFPTNKFPGVGWLGRVHRGTPWQTVYLKSSNILELATSQFPAAGEATWQAWTGNPNADDAINASPAQDRLLFDLFTAAPSDNAMRGQLNVNIGADDPSNSIAGLASWSALLSGINVFSNNVNDTVAGSSFRPQAQNPVSVGATRQNPPGYSDWRIQPVGGPPFPGADPSSPASTPLWNIVQGINNTRQSFTNIDGLSHVFEHVGDILAVPQLSDASPFLDITNNNGLDTAQADGGISDEMYEWLPQQILSLMTVSGTPQAPPRYVVYCYGQALKPAPNGIVTSGQFFGLCTNYQVVAESAERVVIQVDNTPTPANPNAAPHIVVEQYNPLPPD